MADDDYDEPDPDRSERRARESIERSKARPEWLPPQPSPDEDDTDERERPERDDD